MKIENGSLVSDPKITTTAKLGLTGNWQSLREAIKEATQERKEARQKRKLT